MEARLELVMVNELPAEYAIKAAMIERSLKSAGIAVVNWHKATKNADGELVLRPKHTKEHNTAWESW